MKRLTIAVAVLLSSASIALAQAPVTAERRGDVAVGYSFMHETGLDLPLGILLSNGYRVYRNLDVVTEVGINHGSVVGVGVNILTVTGGIRGSSSSRYGAGTSAFGQVLVGLVHASAGTLGTTVGVSGLNIQPGFGIEASASRQIAIRPEMDFLLERFNGQWGHDLRFSVSVVFRLYKQK